MRSFVVLAILLEFALLTPQASAQASDKEARAWQTGKIVQAKEAGMIGGWNPRFTHWYTIETKSERIKATEMVLADGRRIGRKPPMAFKVGEELKIAIEVVMPRGSKRKPDLYIVDGKREEHILTVDEIIPIPQEK